MDSVRNCADLVNKRWKRYAFSEFIRISRKNKKKYPFIEVFMLRIYFFLKNRQKIDFMGHLYQFLLREFKVARKYIFQLREFKMREFMYCAKMMVREL